MTFSPAFPKEFASRHAPWILALAWLLILLPAAANRGIHAHDEGHFLLAANTLVEGVRGVLHGDSVAQLRETLHRSGGTLYFTAKPGHIGLLAAMGLVTGGVRDWLAVMLVVAFGAAGIGALHALARREFTAQPALLAALALMLTPLWVVYSISALGVVTAVGLALVATLCMGHLVQTSRWRLVGAGGLAGLAFTCHYNILPTLAALFLWAALRGCQSRADLLNAARRAGWVLGGFVGLLLLAQATTLAMGAAIGGSYPEFRTYFGELHHAFFSSQVVPEGSVALELPTERQDGVRGYGPAAWGHLAGIALRGMGPLLAMLVLVGVIGIRKKSRLPRIECLRWGVLLLPLVCWALYPWKVERVFVAAVPPLCLLLARLASGIGSPGSQRAWIAVLFMGILGGPHLQWAVLVDKRETLEASPYREHARFAATWLDPADEVLLTGRSFHWRTLPMWKWYLGPERLHRGLPMTAIDFSSRELPLVVALDPESDLPDPEYALNDAAFAVRFPLTRAGAFGFAARDEALALRLLAPGAPAPAGEIE